jgi:two-component system nitrogen regulation sensor histidine kinase NtrY
MVYKRFRVAASLQIALLIVWIGLFFYVLLRTKLFAALVVLGVLVVNQVWILYHSVDRANRDLTRFFQSARFGDFTQTFRERSPGGSFVKLHAALAEVMEAFRNVRAEKEEQALYLQTVVQHVGIGLLVYHPDGEVDLVNDAAKRLLKVIQLKNVRNLEPDYPALVDVLLRIKPRERALVKIERGDEQFQLSLYASEFKLRGWAFTLVSLQDIRSELEEKEIEAWQKLIRVLTHEIMNSMTPISSLASTVQELVSQVCGEGGTETVDDIHAALRTIQKRSEGLLHFVDGYRNLARISRPNVQFFPATDLFLRVDQLLQAQFAERNVRLGSSVRPPNLEILADPDLLEQVLINLLINGLDAVRGRDNPKVELDAFLDDRGRPLIQVKDNGMGIAPDVLDKIFVPFFSTKERGSGIGLSLSRQIMRLHGGSITAASKLGVETVFTLRFRI